MNSLYKEIKNISKIVNSKCRLYRVIRKKFLIREVNKYIKENCNGNMSPEFLKDIIRFLFTYHHSPDPAVSDNGVYCYYCDDMQIMINLPVYSSDRFSIAFRYNKNEVSHVSLTYNGYDIACHYTNERITYDTMSDSTDDIMIEVYEYINYVLSEIINNYILYIRSRCIFK